MNVRRGVTLLEVLIAIFVAAIGMLAILALFPLGAIKMAQAIQAGRVGYTAAKASSVAESRDVRHDPAFYMSANNPWGLPAYDLAINNPATGLPNLGSQAPPLVSYDGPGYPIYVDPFGVLAGMGNVGGSIARSNVTLANPPPPPPPNPPPYLPAPTTLTVAQGIYWFSLLDDIQFENDGQNPGLVRGLGTLPVNRTNRYSFAFMLRRPRFSDAAVVDASVVVYEKRPIQAASNEYVYPSGAVPGNAVTGASEVTLYYTTEKPPIRKGGWILDATVMDPANPTVPSPQGVFYRVTDVTDVSTPTTGIALQLEQPLRAGSSQRYFVIMEGVVEVIERGSGWKP